MLHATHAPPSRWMSVHAAACRGDMHHTCGVQRLCRAGAEACLPCSVRACIHTRCAEHGIRDVSQTIHSSQLFASRLSTDLGLQAFLNNIVSQPGSCEHPRSRRNLCSLLAPASPAERVQRGQYWPKHLFDCPHHTAILQTQHCALAESTAVVRDLQQQIGYLVLCGAGGEDLLGRSSPTVAGEALEQ